MTLTVEERVDWIYAEIIQGVFGDFYNSGPGDFIVEFVDGEDDEGYKYILEIGLRRENDE